MYLHTIRVELSLLHETIFRVDIVVRNVAWESVKVNIPIFSRCLFNLRALIIYNRCSSYSVIVRVSVVLKRTVVGD